MFVNGRRPQSTSEWKMTWAELGNNVESILNRYRIHVKCIENELIQNQCGINLCKLISKENFINKLLTMNFVVIFLTKYEFHPQVCTVPRALHNNAGSLYCLSRGSNKI